MEQTCSECHQAPPAVDEAGKRIEHQAVLLRFAAAFSTARLVRSHQSATRGWLKPTWMTDSLVRKDLFGHTVNKGFLPDVHCPTGAPREAIVKITKAEPGGIDGKGIW